MSTLWVVDRSPGIRSVLSRLVAGGDRVASGPPVAEDFAAQPAPDAVVLGVSEDFDLELHFAAGIAARHPESAWIVVAAAEDLAEARRLFGALPIAVLRYPPERRRLGPLLQGALRRRAVDTLADRIRRRIVSLRFERWFGDLRDLPELLQATNPDREGVSILVRGEPGTGRGLLARYVHLQYLHDAGRAAGATAGGSFRHVPCAGLSPDALRTALALGDGLHPRDKLTVCLEDVDRLPRATQLELRDWIETGLPGRVAPSALRLRWIGLAAEADDPDVDPGLDPGLEQVLSALSIRIPPLRERAGHVPAFVDATTAAWCRERRQPRRFREDALAVLLAHVFPGNLRELEAAVVRTLASTDASEIGPENLRLVETPAVFVPAAPPTAGGAPAPPPAPEVTLEEAEAAIAAVGPAAEAPEVEPADTAPAARGLARGGVRRLLHAVAHEVRNPLVSIRTLADLLPERHGDAEFRTRFVGLVGDDVRRIEHVVATLSRLAELSAPERELVDVSAQIEEILDACRDRIQQRRLVVLQELDRSRGACLGDSVQIGFALEALLGKALELVPDRGDVYVSSRHHPSGLDGGPTLRVLIRFQTPEAVVPGAHEGVSIWETALDVIVAEAVIRAGGGSLEISQEGDRETVIAIDLAAPER